MNNDMNHLEKLWDDLLSRQPGPIKTAYSSLDSAGQQTVIAHLQRMVTETGWQPDQRLSAEVALQVLITKPNRDQ